MNVQMYATSWCGDCRAARQFLDSHGIEYTEIDVDADPAASGPTAWDRAHLVLHTVDREPVRLPRVPGDEIDRLRGATICRQGGRFFTLGAGRECPASFSLDSMTYVTLPSSWLDDDT